jgi:hypothetical protein
MMPSNTATLNTQKRGHLCSILPRRPDRHLRHACRQANRETSRHNIDAREKPFLCLFVSEGSVELWQLSLCSRETKDVGCRVSFFVSVALEKVFDAFETVPVYGSEQEPEAVESTASRGATQSKRLELLIRDESDTSTSTVSRTSIPSPSLEMPRRLIAVVDIATRLVGYVPA